MNRFRRGAIFATVACTAIVGGLAPAADAAPEPAAPQMSTQTRNAWACVAIRGVDLGFCLDNPLPGSNG